MLCEKTGKRSHGSRRAAHDAMRSASNKVRVYRCEHCDAYHVTSGAERDRARPRKRYTRKQRSAALRDH